MDDITALLLGLVSISHQKYFNQPLPLPGLEGVKEEQRCGAFWGAPWGLVVLDDSSQNCLEYVNEAACKMLGAGYLDLFGKAAVELVDPGLEAQVCVCVFSCVCLCCLCAPNRSYTSQQTPCVFVGWLRRCAALFMTAPHAAAVAPVPASFCPTYFCLHLNPKPHPLFCLHLNPSSCLNFQNPAHRLIGRLLCVRPRSLVRPAARCLS